MIPLIIQFYFRNVKNYIQYVSLMADISQCEEHLFTVCARQPDLQTSIKWMFPFKPLFSECLCSIENMYLHTEDSVCASVSHCCHFWRKPLPFLTKHQEKDNLLGFRILHKALGRLSNIITNALISHSLAVVAKNVCDTSSVLSDESLPMQAMPIWVLLPHFVICNMSASKWWQW